MNPQPTDPFSRPSPNPFATRFIRPGAIPFLFLPGESLESLQRSWLAAGGWGQIIGPHGTGKSTLLQLWEGALRHAGQSVLACRLTTERPLPPHKRLLNWSEVTQDVNVLCDGWEQLPWLRRRRFLREVRQRKGRLLVTGHRDFGFSWTYRTAGDLPRMQQMVAWLQRQTAPLVTADDTAMTWARSRGNVRETLLALYDVYRERANARHDDDSSD